MNKEEFADSVNYRGKLLDRYIAVKSSGLCNCEQIDDLSHFLESARSLCKEQETRDTIDELHHFLSVELDNQVAACTCCER